jgi:flagellar basal-body rod protein FlgG
MEAQQTKIDVIANNLANVNTTGFKKSRAEFQDLLYQTMKAVGSPTSQSTNSPTGVEVGLGVRTVATQKVFTMGDLMQTNNQLDLAIEGAGFFQIQKPDGNPAYTRTGSFKIDATGKMVNSDGYALDPNIVIPPEATSVTIGADGTVSATMPGEAQATAAGNITLVNFVNPAGLRSIGKGLFEATEVSGSPSTGTPGEGSYGSLSQGFLESSNVKVVDEMIDMIAAQRAYELNSKVISTAEQMLRKATNFGG